MKLAWKLHERMAAAGLRFGSDLSEALGERRYPITPQHINRLIKQRSPGRLSFVFIEHLCEVLGCTPNELFGHSGAERISSPAAPAPTAGRSLELRPTKGRQAQQVNPAFQETADHFRASLLPTSVGNGDSAGE